MWRMAKFGKRAQKKRGSRALALLLSSIKSWFFFSRPLVHSDAALHHLVSRHCAFMFHGCVTSSDMKYLLWHVPVTLVLPINRCNFLLLLWKIAGKCDQSASCCRQPAAILKPEKWNFYIIIEFEMTVQLYYTCTIEKSFSAAYK